MIAAGKVALIERIRDGMTYYVFPGGGIEPGETAEETVTREVFEEVGVRVIIKDDSIHSKREDGSEETYFFAEMVSGIFGNGQGEEFKPGRQRGSYTPVWVDLRKIESFDVRPHEVAARLIEKRDADEL